MHFWIDKRSQACGGAPPGRLRGPPLPPHRRHQAHSLFRSGRSTIPRCSIAKPPYRPRSRLNAPPGRTIPPLHHNAVLPPSDHPPTSNITISRPPDSLPSVPLGHPSLDTDFVAVRNAECLHSQGIRPPPPHLFGEELLSSGSQNGGPPSPESVGKLRCGMWVGFSMGIFLVGGTKLYFAHQGSGVEVLVFCAMLLLFFLGCIVSICRARRERQLEQQFVEACHHSRPIDHMHHSEPSQHIVRQNIGTTVPQPDVVLTPLATPECGLSREDGGPPPPYHIAILLPQPPGSLSSSPPPSYTKATT
ncbi:hypothetical protein J437_LFUL003525 [Ladona fulva]|uniref:Uncharacterized protein n=1 Tax=Ladona fulva TaxID=123851 RepID=A0A8K0JUF7_LADFU|nr:hypothetical protein J437_LFUL003525 [Ladona fulva]